jgi:hypothetical protein
VIFCRLPIRLGPIARHVSSTVTFGMGIDGGSEVVWSTSTIRAPTSSRSGSPLS